MYSADDKKKGFNISSFNERKTCAQKYHKDHRYHVEFNIYLSVLTKRICIWH